MDYAKWTFWLIMGNILVFMVGGGILFSRRLEAPKNLPVVRHDTFTQTDDI
jgi:hypothetical protein